jgi:hypothetical protein
MHVFRPDFASYMCSTGKQHQGWRRNTDESDEARGQRLSRYSGKLLSFPSVVNWLVTERRISIETLQHYQVGAVEASFSGGQKQCVTFPWFTDGVQHPVRAKLRAYNDKKCMRLDPAGAIWGFFGWNTIGTNDELVVLTEGELDAMTVYQEIGIKALSLPNGANSLPPELIKLLERFKTIYMWLDDDIPGQVSPFAQIMYIFLGMARCRHPWPGPCTQHLVILVSYPHLSILPPS